MMANEEKAKEICGRGVDGCDLDCLHCVQYFDLQSLIEIAEWKDMQYRAFLDNLVDLGADSELIVRMLKQYGINQ